MKQMDIFEAAAARDHGIQTAADHAEAVNPGRNESAYQLLLKFIADHPGGFMTEDLRSFAALVDFPLPPDGRAWGGIITRAVKAGKIKSIGYQKVKNKISHCRPSTLWQAIKK